MYFVNHFSNKKCGVFSEDTTLPSSEKPAFLIRYNNGAPKRGYLAAASPNPQKLKLKKKRRFCRCYDIKRFT
jgi:hypothetical protein